MSNDFFNNHPTLGSLFDFNHDGSMNLGEAGAMTAMGHMAASELMRATRESEREQSHYSPSKRRKGRVPDSCDFDDDFVEYDDTRVYDIDASDAASVMQAVTSGYFDEADIEYLVREALCEGAEFDRDDAEEILENIRDSGLREWVESYVD